MNEIIWMENPMEFIAIAQWLACMVFLIPVKKKIQGVWFCVTSVVVLGMQYLFMSATGYHDAVPLSARTLGALFIMLAFIYAVADTEFRAHLYFTACAFMLAEFLAALNWQMNTYPIYFGLGGIWIRTLITAIIYGGGAIIAYFMERGYCTADYLRALKWRDVITAAGIATAMFFLSNLGLIMPDTDLFSTTTWDRFQQRTLVDFIGVAILYAYQSRLAEYVKAREAEIMKRALESKYEEYKANEASVEFIRVKYHDLKHQIDGLRAETDGEKRKEWIDKLEREVNEHELFVPTGNSILDSLIASRLIQAKNENVRLTCVADGKLLDFMDPADICTIFGNALDNAIEAVRTIEEEEKRVIHMTVAGEKRFVIIMVQNYCEKPPRLGPDGLPRTSKKDRDNHGLGVKSIKAATQRYDGTLTVDVKDNWFRIRILIPMA